MVSITSLNRLWRIWLRNESPRRPLLPWSTPNKVGLGFLCLAIALITSFSWLQVPEFGPGVPALKDELAPSDGLVQYNEAQQQGGSEIVKRKIFVQVIDKDQSARLKERLIRKLGEVQLVANSSDVARIGPVDLNEDEQLWVINRTKKIRSKWESAVNLAAQRMLSQGLVNTISIDQLREASSLQLAELGDKNNPARTIGSKVLTSTFQGNSNLRKDSNLQGLLEDTITRQSRILKVKEGDVIIKKGEPISPQDYYVLEHFNLIKKSPKIAPFLRTFSEAIVSCGVLLLIMRRERPCLQPRHGFFALGLLLIVQGSQAWFGSASTPLAVLIPPTILLSQGLGSTSAFAWLAVSTLLWKLPISEIGEGRMTVAFVVAAIISLQGSRMRSRAQLLQMAFLLPFGALIFEWFFLRGIERPTSSDDLVYEALVMGALLMLTILLIPILETSFGLITRARLMELADQERPLLRRLSREAPGTFEHTLMLCGLAEEGARIIGADVDLIRTGALYHDIGKLHAPEWFIENQTDAINPHDELNDPYKSANILQAHVDEGLKLAKRYRLPRPIADFIPEHQGTLKMGYFLHQAQSKSLRVDESDFRYKGPTPRSRETAILMLADGCEAALRSLDPETTNEEACKTVRKIIESRQFDGQLKESSLKRAEVELVIRAFVKVWRRMRHRRIPYPIPRRKGSYQT